MIRLSILLIFVPIALLIVWYVKKILRHSETDAILEKIKDDGHAYAVVKDLDTTQIKQQREELARIKKELQ